MTPLDNFVIPIGPAHPGSFGVWRKHDVHTGLDLYCNDGDRVRSITAGKVIRVSPFTGPKAGSPWWHDTDAVVVETSVGYLVYGELDSTLSPKIGSRIKKGRCLGTVKAVLPEGKKRADILGHSNSMLHIELWALLMETYPVWKVGQPRPKGLIDPTSYIMSACTPRKERYA